MNFDLICVVPDKDTQAALEALLKHRCKALGLRRIQSTVIPHPERDPGCYKDGSAFLGKLLSGNQAKGLLVLDQAWDGNPHSSALETESEIRKKMTGLEGRAEVVVIEPELEAWVWSASKHVPLVLGWEEGWGELRRWLGSRGLWSPGRSKPEQPKEAVEAALYQKRIPRSSSIYRNLAKKVSVHGCEDASFGRLTNILKAWFGVGSAGLRV